MKTKIRAFMARHRFLSQLAALLVPLVWPGWLMKEIRAACAQFEITEEKARRIRRDMRFCYLYYRISPEEYCRYEFERYSDTERKKFVGEAENGPFFAQRTSPENRAFFKNKYKTYLFFQPYYRRRAISVTEESDFEPFSAFLKEEKRVVTKPIDQSFGRGVAVVDADQVTDSRSLFEELIRGTGSIVEEWIRQDARMAAFHPGSVNTIRAITLQTDGAAKLLAACVRLGTGESVVDNGCLSASVDIDSGVITTRGRLAHKKGLYLFHPDSGRQILGFRIPEWEALKALVLDLAGKVPTQKVIGWDMALSEKGWLVVEANTAPSIQILLGEGIGAREILKQIAQA